jgi:hypothetical protein
MLGDNETLRLFACWLTKELFKLTDNVQVESIRAVRITELYMYNLATLEELKEAQQAAEEASYKTNTQLEFAVAWAAAKCAGRVAWQAAHDVSGAAIAATYRTDPPLNKDDEVEKQVDKLIQLLERKDKQNGKNSNKGS